MRTLVNFVVLSFLSTGHLYPQTERYTDWVLEKNENAIKVYTRYVEGLSIKEFKATTTIDISIDIISKLVNDPKTYADWMANTKKNYILKTIDMNTRYDYFEAELPWPLRNRDDVMLVTKTKNPHTGQITITLKGVPDYIPDKPGLVRMPLADGLWQFTPNNDGTVYITYRLIGDPGGYIPAWVANLFLVDGPFKTLCNLQQYARSLK